MTRHLSRMAAWVLAAALPLATQAACLSDEQVDELVRHYLARTPAPTPLGLSDTDGACTRAKLHVRLEKALGKPVIGYKAGLTNPAVQQRFQTDQPVWGRLYDGMIQPNGSAFEAAFGARPLYEADMLVRVSGTAINQARTPADVLAAIDQVIPFVELPDLAVQEPPSSTAPRYRPSTSAHAWAWQASRSPCRPTRGSDRRCSTPCATCRFASPMPRARCSARARAATSSSTRSMPSSGWSRPCAARD
jgi:hypothetical protein